MAYIFDSSPVYYFLDRLSQWDYDIPLTTQWSVIIEPEMSNFGSSDQFFQKIGEYTQIDKTGFVIHPNMQKRVLSELTQPVVNGLGLYYAQKVRFPKEEFSVQGVGVDGMGGYLKGVVANDRYEMGARSLNIDFLETNLDFNDALIRPWMIACSYRGLIDLGPQDSLKANIYIYQFTKNIGEDVEKPIRKIHLFQGCVPYNITEDEINYESEQINIKTVNFTYTNYTYKVFSSK